MKQVKSITVALDYEDIYRGPVVLVNRTAPLRTALPERALTDVALGVRLEKQAALLYEAVLRTIGAEAQIVPVSGYRSHSEQQQIYAGVLMEQGKAYADTYVALPGCSEHETGLAIDVAAAAPDIDFIAPHFPYEGVCQRFRQQAVRHGFIQRYPEGKEHVTGIGHEPWHFRYVGIPHAQLITQRGLTLEEYVDWLRGCPLEEAPCHFTADGRAYDIGYVKAQKGKTHIALGGEPYTISGNNVDGFIVAVWRCDG